MPTTLLQKNPNGTFVTSVPRSFITALDLKKGDRLSWHILFKEHALTLKKVKK